MPPLVEEHYLPLSNEMQRGSVVFTYVHHCCAWGRLDPVSVLVERAANSFDDIEAEVDLTDRGGLPAERIGSAVTGRHSIPAVTNDRLYVLL